MKEDALQDLLTRADEAASPAVVTGVIDRVRKKRRRRARRRAGMAALSIACVAVLVILPRLRPAEQIAIKPTGSVDQIRAEVAAYDAAAELHERAARALQAAEMTAQRRSDHLILLLQPDARSRIEQARNRAALLLLREGERAADNPQNLPSARESYQRAARLFPETPAGRLAAERLALLM